MKGLKFIAVAVMLLVATMVSAQTTGIKFGTPYETPTFSATFPVADANPVTADEDDTIQVPIPGTDKNGTIHSYFLMRKNEAIFQVAFIKFPAATSLNNDTATLDRMLDASLDEKYAHLVSVEKADAQIGSLPSRQAISHQRGSMGDIYGWQRLAVVPNGVWKLMVACPEKSGCTTADAVTFFDSVLIKSPQAPQPTQTRQLAESTQTAQTPRAPQSAQAPESHARKIFLEYNGPGGDGDRVTNAATKEFLKNCPTVVITSTLDAADLSLNVLGGKSTLSNKEGSVVYVSTARFKMGNLVKDVCNYVNSH
jgi:hypothetical protein